MTINLLKKCMLVTSGVSCLFALKVLASPDPTIPADKFDLSNWKITVPTDLNRDQKIDEVDTKGLQKFNFPPYFYLDKNGHMVFTAPNKAATTSGSSNTRSELRQMILGKKARTSHDPRNNFVLAAHKKAKKFGSIGGRMEATLRVNHVAKNAGHPNKPPAYSVVVGQIHAGKDKKLVSKGDGFGWGNEPLKIYYKKWPNHQTGSVFWNYERNLPKSDPDRVDIDHVVWGKGWGDPSDPGASGVLLGEEFSYVVNVHKNIMTLIFTSPNKPPVNFQVDLSNNIDANGIADAKDNPKGYSGDWMYFKAGAYDQCSSKDAEGMWYTACAGTGEWKTDYLKGDYTSVAFSSLKLSESIEHAPLKQSRHVVLGVTNSNSGH